MDILNLDSTKKMDRTIPDSDIIMGANAVLAPSWVGLFWFQGAYEPDMAPTRIFLVAASEELFFTAFAIAQWKKYFRRFHRFDSKKAKFLAVLAASFIFCLIHWRRWDFYDLLRGFPLLFGHGMIFAFTGSLYFPFKLHAASHNILGVVITSTF